MAPRAVCMFAVPRVHKCDLHSKASPIARDSERYCISRLWAPGVRHTEQMLAVLNAKVARFSSISGRKSNGSPRH